MVRQDEARRPEPATVVLDVRTAVHDEASFELAVEAAASVVVALARSGRPTQLVTSTGVHLGRAGEESTLDRLAEVLPEGQGQLVLPTGDPRRSREIGLLVVVTGAPAPADVAAVAAGAPHGSRTILVATGPVAPAAAGRPMGPDPANVVRVDTSETPFATAWNRTMQTWNRANPS
jgi:uncharacterized protein (DUF58 family)